MDPNATLARLRELAAEIFQAETEEQKAELADEIAEHVEALDGWISRGGFLPAAWARETITGARR